MRILLVEDDHPSALFARAILQGASMVVDTVGTGEEAIEMARIYDYDLMLLDLGLPDMDGYDVLRALRAGRNPVPVLMLSANARPDARVKALNTGADDFLTKPFDGRELVARIQAIVRRGKGYCEPSLSMGNLSLNLGSREVCVGDRQVHLTGKEFAILELLMLRRGMTQTKEAFLNHLYGGLDEPDAKIIDVFVCKLRKKLSDAGAGNVIGTVWGRGYVMREPTAEVTRMPGRGATGAPVAETVQAQAA